MKSVTVQLSRFAAAATAGAILLATTAASAQCVPCRPAYEPGMLAFLAGLFTPGAPECVRCLPMDQHDYIVDQGPVYSGPALIAPHATYAPSPMAVGYPYVLGYGIAPEHRAVRQLPPRRKIAQAEKKASAKQKAEVINAHAVVKIYGPERMDIRLYRNKK